MELTDSKIIVLVVIMGAYVHVQDVGVLNCGIVPSFGVSCSNVCLALVLWMCFMLQLLCLKRKA